MQGDLTTLAKVQQWLALPDYKPATNDTLAALITTVSAVVVNYLGRQGLRAQTVQTVYDTWGNDFILLRGGPIISISAVELGGSTLTPATTTTWPPTSGWDLEPLDPTGTNQQRLTLYGCRFPYGRRTLRVTAMAGFLTSETQVIPTEAPYQLQMYYTYLGDETFLYPNGTPFVLAPAPPGPGQYSIDPTGLAQFNAVDAGVPVGMSYSFVPPDIDNAVVQMVGEDYNRRTRIGLRSLSVGGTSTTSYDLSDMPQRVKLALAPYRTVTPS
jgi:hypothetical protein